MARQSELIDIDTHPIELRNQGRAGSSSNTTGRNGVTQGTAAEVLRHIKTSRVGLGADVIDLSEREAEIVPLSSFLVIFHLGSCHGLFPSPIAPHPMTLIGREGLVPEGTANRHLPGRWGIQGRAGSPLDRVHPERWGVAASNLRKVGGFVQTQ
tara:strand:- start:18141 stop:18602 length:462 start_codon:yes stop_codon:yes gene_type:complete